jgi:hypothetical protein
VAETVLVQQQKYQQRKKLKFMGEVEIKRFSFVTTRKSSDQGRLRLTDTKKKCRKVKPERLKNSSANIPADSQTKHCMKITSQRGGSHIAVSLRHLVSEAIRPLHNHTPNALQ